MAGFAATCCFASTVVFFDFAFFWVLLWQKDFLLITTGSMKESLNLCLMLLLYISFFCGSVCNDIFTKRVQPSINSLAFLLIVAKKRCSVNIFLNWIESIKVCFFFDAYHLAVILNIYFLIFVKAHFFSRPDYKKENSVKLGCDVASISQIDDVVANYRNHFHVPAINSTTVNVYLRYLYWPKLSLLIKEAVITFSTNKLSVALKTFLEGKPVNTGTSTEILSDKGYSFRFIQIKMIDHDR